MVPVRASVKDERPVVQEQAERHEADGPGRGSPASARREGFEGDSHQTTCIRGSRFAAAVAIAAEVRETAAKLESPSLSSRAEELVRQARGRIVVDEPWRPLTAREFDVARLISEGLTNAEIAESLGIAPKTASSHVEHILAKLGASRRAEIATWAASVDRSAAAH
jgi:DNA-binding CsgD family transcriptional regulator